MKMQTFQKNYQNKINFFNSRNIKSLLLTINESEEVKAAIEFEIFIEVSTIIKLNQKDIPEIEELFSCLFGYCNSFKKETIDYKDGFRCKIYGVVKQQYLEKFVNNFELKIIEILNNIINFKSSIPDFDNRMRQLGF